MPEPTGDIIRQPGKFEGEWLPAESLYEMPADEETGDVETTGFYVLYTFSDADKNELAKKYPALSDEIKKLVGAIGVEDSQGFFSVDWYESESELEKAWEDVLEEVEATGAVD